jgi:hypothetical protein
VPLAKDYLNDRLDQQVLQDPAWRCLLLILHMQQSAPNILGVLCFLANRRGLFFSTLAFENHEKSRVI